MTADQYTELVEFLGRKFDAIEHRLTALEVSHEAMRDDIRALAEGQAGINARMDRLEARLDAFESETRAGMDRLEARLDAFESETRAGMDRLEARLNAFESEARAGFSGLEVRFDRFEVDFGTVVLDHGRRIRALEQPDRGG